MRMYCGIVLAGIFLLTTSASKPEQCGGDIKIKEPGYLTSPGYPNQYFPYQNCVWIIQAPEPYQRILINFNPHFDLEDRECKYDYVEVHDGGDENSHLLGKYCGKIAPSPLQSTSPLLYIKFVSDYETHGAGFSIRFEVLKTGAECSRNFTRSSGVIKSPGYPEKYPNNLECTYIIFAPNMDEIVLDFENFDLEADSNPPHGAVCRYDRLEIWDGIPGVGAFIGRYCGQNSPGRIRSFTGVLSIYLQTDNAIAKEGFSANFTVITKSTVEEEISCLEPLGLESGDITSDQITASSQYNTDWSLERSRLNYRENAWTPASDNTKEWIQVDFGFLRMISAIGTQGATSKETKLIYYVKSYKVDVSSNGEDWITVKDGSKHKIFQGNTNPTDVVVGHLSKPILTRFVRIKPLTWQEGIAMRFEIYGCKISDYPCSGMLGMVTGLITDGQITASNHGDRSWNPENARLLTSRSVWTLPAQSQPYTKEWLQIDLSEEKKVHGLIIQGGRHRENKVFMRKYKIGYSNNGSDWKMILDSSGLKPKIFEGNSNYDTPEMRTFDVLLTRFIRIIPERASLSGFGLRVELLGCEITAPTSVPSTTATSLVDECDDDQANCHSGTGDDYDLTGVSFTPSTEEPTETTTSTVKEMSDFNCNFGMSLKQTLCGWQQEEGNNFPWILQSSGKPSTGSFEDHSGGGNFLCAQANGNPENNVVRLLGPSMTPSNSFLCMSFWYHIVGSHIGTLSIKLRTATTTAPEGRVDFVLWTLSGHQGNRWREGRVIIPETTENYRVVIEADISKNSWGDIAVDDIEILELNNSQECRDPEPPFDPTVSFGNDIDDIVEPNIYPNPGNDIEESPGNMLKTLDPILITIIAMSALGVFLGAICGVVLYCACSHSGMGDRNLSALENYNFELVDGVKLKKEKLNTMNSYSEA
ncbi:neuropilin-1a isoform X1 [Polypterus senegalus]|uniref:neuropilin-1a isoform X1 n=1 Tax=Polypterus senegalus TaxID=55291 RepID=UPI00196233AB|nr:neuropilin-1a isoform X1 [Polypterus senegalus]